MADEAPSPIDDVAAAVGRIEARLEDALRELDHVQRLLWRLTHAPTDAYPEWMPK